jgi:hypothetical protein
MIGQKFGKWTVIADTDKKLTKQNFKAWICQCDCERKTKRYVPEVSLKTGKSKSCGKCLPWRKWEGPKELER